MDIDQARKFGQMESRLDALESTCHRLETRSSRIEDMLDTVVQALSSSAGGKTMLITLLTLSAVVGGFVTKVWETFLR